MTVINHKLFSKSFTMTAKATLYMVCPLFLLVWYDSISDVERADVSMLDDVISVRDGYKQCDCSKDEILLTIEIICTN